MFDESPVELPAEGGWGLDGLRGRPPLYEVLTTCRVVLTKTGAKPILEGMKNAMQSATVREFSVAGRCINRGPLVRETAKFYVYLTGAHGVSGPDAEIVEKRIAKPMNGSTLVHVIPCRSCDDFQRQEVGG